ncbi:receptor-like protein 43 [Ziziphus jujuba]|uniref:Receptor-like protein 43 n=1 Tax=Ziziphus jujuba TaxID=326968 RepID=A0ABM3ZRU9_ZIZJJ|nr:receptor-like protein 43 [Ziziphus jujuba]
MGWFSWLYYMILLFFISSSVSSSSIPLSSAPPPFPSFPSCHIDDSKALLQFKNSFSIDHTLSCGADFPPPTIFWESGTDCCGWIGLTCNNITGHVIGLDLTCCMLWGIIHSNSSLFLLRHLQTLILSLDNDFRGSTIPPEFGTFTDLLHLEIWSANFAGDIPLEISYLSKLQTLEVYSGNQQLRLNTSTFKRIVTNLTNLQNLTLADVDMSRIDLCFFDEFVIFFDIPLPLLLSLRILDLSGTNFSIDILDPTRNLKSLDGLYLSNCRLIGSYPVLFGNLTQLASVGLSNNNISGQIPWSSFNPKRLTYLSLAERIPWKNLQFLDLHSNILHGHLPIPPPSVEVFSISHNQLIGEVPLLICNLSSLEVLDLANNGMSGKLPPCIGNLSGSLSVLDIRMNKFHGTIPRQLFAKENILRNLNLNGNEFEGSLPRSLLNCKKLEVLDIGNNHINGMFPHWLESLQML